MSVPTDLLYTEGHEWARAGEDEVITVGITNFAQEQLGGIVYVELPNEGTEVAKGDPIGQIESTKSVSDIYAPASGTVIEINRTVDGSPELVNSHPYEDGWLFRIRLEAPEELCELVAGQREELIDGAGSMDP